MRDFAVLDCETDPFLVGRVPSPFVWGYFDGREFVHYSHDTIDSLLEKISEQKIIVYAHNGGRFDYHFLLDKLEPYDDIKIINGRIAQFFMGKAEFRDSFNILPVALKKFELIDSTGEIVKKQEFDYSRMEESERYKPENWASIIEYLRDDCVTLYEAIKQFQSEYGRHLTQAGAALAQWKSISKRAIPKSTPDFFSHFKTYYYGGRVQCFRFGVIEAAFSVFDINSAYPRAMLDNHPYGLDYIESTKELAEYPRGPAFFRIKARSMGAFPYRSKTGLIFPDDNEIREFYITGWELLAAEETDTAGEYELLSVIYFPELISFHDYIEYFYEKRLTAKATGDKAGDLFAKLLMNSLYGKFGSNPENYESFMILPIDELESLKDEDNQYRLSGDLGPWLLAARDLEDEEMTYYNVATAASITGFVRAFLWRSICLTGKENMLYCDTDSIATMSAGNELETGKELGKWKHEGEFIRAGIGGKKMYIFEPKSGKDADYKTASKGVKLSNDELWKVAQGGTVEYTPEGPTFSVHKKPAFITRRVTLTK
jgi:DNA polymerase elongation subunit (family B)